MEAETFEEVKTEIPAETLVQEYQQRGILTSRLIRSFGHFLAYFLFVCTIFFIYGVPRAPIRGIWCQWINFIVVLLAGIATIWFIFFVLDAVRLCSRFMQLISSDRIVWQKTVLRTEAIRHGVSGEALDRPHDWLRHPLYIRMITDHSTFICGYIATPFVVLLLMILSRYSAFDNWHWPPHLIVVYILHALILAWCAWLANKAALRIKKQAVATLREAVLDPQNADQRLSIEQACKEIEDNTQGAFSFPLYSPVVRAIMIPFGGVGALALLDYLVQRT